MTDSTEFDAILAAMTENRRGRMFLAEFARRDRQRDKSELSDALVQLERAITRRNVRHDQAAKHVLQALSDAAAPGALLARVDQAVGELDGIVAATTSTTAAMLLAAKNIRELAERMLDQRLGDEVLSLAADIEAAAYQSQVGNRTREIFDLLLELKGLLENQDTPEIVAEARTVIHAPAAPAKVVTSASIAAANDSGPRDILAPLRALSEDERIAVFT